MTSLLGTKATLINIYRGKEQYNRRAPRIVTDLSATLSMLHGETIFDEQSIVRNRFPYRIKKLCLILMSCDQLNQRALTDALAVCSPLESSHTPTAGLAILQHTLLIS